MITPNLTVGQKFPKIDYSGFWDSVHYDMQGKIVYAKSHLKYGKVQTMDILVKRVANGCTQVTRNFCNENGCTQIISLFDKNENPINCAVRENGKLVAFTRTSIKKLKNYKVSPKKIIRLINSALKKATRNIKFY